jgi:tetrahydromethanopterin S-methyltransferase subunit F
MYDNSSKEVQTYIEDVRRYRAQLVTKFVKYQKTGIFDELIVGQDYYIIIEKELHKHPNQVVYDQEFYGNTENDHQKKFDLGKFIGFSDTKIQFENTTLEPQLNLKDDFTIYSKELGTFHFQDITRLRRLMTIKPVKYDTDYSKEFETYIKDISTYRTQRATPGNIMTIKPVTYDNSKKIQTYIEDISTYRAQRAIPGNIHGGFKTSRKSNKTKRSKRRSRRSRTRSKRRSRSRKTNK